MLNLDLERTEFTETERPSTRHCNRIIDDDANISINGKLAIVYRASFGADSQLRPILDRVKFGEYRRSGGLKVTAKSVGWLRSKSDRRGNKCSMSEIIDGEPSAMGPLEREARKLADLYKTENQRLYAEHFIAVRGTNADGYRIGETPFTSGSANANRVLAYHLDAGNFPRVWSAMSVHRDPDDGGQFICPELQIGFATTHGSAVLFDGQSLIHGVTPLVDPESRRYSIVFYSAQQVWSCEPARRPLN